MRKDRNILCIFAEYMSMKFTLQHKDPSSHARAGELHTDHGVIRTPIFMPVGTAATVKGIFHRDVRDEARAQIILANTYHLYLRPGTEILERAGGVHRFSTWEGPMLTDSGGFQVFSLAACRKLKEEGCHFRSHIDGSKHLFTPESVIDTERTIGADIMMAFDECPPGDAPREYAAKSLGLTERWLDRCFNQYHRTSPKYGHYQALFPIVQGCTYPDLRARAAENVKQYDADGYAIGGLAVGEPTEVMYEMIEVVNAILPEDRPRYLMGVGTPVNILEGIERGVDMFDCVMPTRNGRNGQLFTAEGVINIRNKKWEDDFSPVDPAGTAFVDRLYSKAYLHHLCVCGEMLAAEIASLSLTLNLWLIPISQRHIVAFEQQYIKRKQNTKYDRHIYRQIEPGIFAYIRGYNDGARQASFFVLERYESGTMTHSLEASDAKFNPETKRWTAPRYTKREFDSAGTETFEQFRNLDTLINLEATELGEINDLIQTMNISELNAFLDQQRAKGSDSINLIEVEKHARYAYPLSTFILTLIGVSLSSRKVRGGTGLHIGIGTGLCFSYILFNRFFEEFAKSGTLPPGLAVWLPNIIYLGIAVYLYRKAPK